MRVSHMSQATLSRHLGSVNDALALFEEDLVGAQVCNDYRLHGIDYLWTSDGTLVPSVGAPFVSPYLYRGQVARHQPCIPSVFRGLSSTDDPLSLPSADRSRLFADRVKLEEFVLAIEGHPACAYAREIGLRLQQYGLAQHYELATDRLDLTQDHRVAAFFATNELVDGVWLPVERGVGVIYRLHTTSFQRHFKDRLECLGKQAFPRPGEQKGYTLSLSLGTDFEALPVEVFTFDHAHACSAALNRQYEEGGALFPPDVMSEVAAAINEAPTLPRRLVEHLLASDQLSGPFVRLKDFLQHLAGRICDRSLIGLSASQLDRAAAAVESMRSTFLDRVGALPVRLVG